MTGSQSDSTAAKHTAQAAGKPQAHSPGGPGGPGGHGEGQRSLPPIAVAVQTAAQGDIATYYHTTATLEPNKQAAVMARVAGVVMELLAEEGDVVANDQVLMRIEEAEYQHRMRQTEAEVAKQRARFDRLQKMVTHELVATEEFESARSDLLSAEANRDLAALELSHTDVRAPFAGRITRRAIDRGQMVTGGQELFTVMDLNLLLARVHVPAREFRSLQVDQIVELVLDSNGQRLQGRISLVSPVIDATSGTIKVTVEITDYPAGIRPGDFAEVRIVTDRHQDVILLPKIAVLTEKGEQVVYVALPDSTADRRVVATGYQNDMQTEVVSGVEAGEMIITQGQRSLEQGQPLRIHERKSYDAESAEQAATAPQGRGHRPGH